MILHLLSDAQIIRSRQFLSPERLLAFLDNIMPEPNSGCWLWMGKVDRRGYACFAGGSAAHRISHAIFKGYIPDGMRGCHKCDIRSCVNPDHIWAGTDAQNSEDMIRKGRTGPIWARDVYHDEKAASLLVAMRDGRHFEV